MMYYQKCFFAGKTGRREVIPYTKLKTEINFR